MSQRPTVYGRYAVYQEIACGGMASVHLGRVQGAVGFTRVVAIKRLLPQFVKDPEFVAMFLDEARLAARIRHPNVVPTLDVVATGGELLLVMEYVHGLSLSALLKSVRTMQEKVPIPVVCSILVGALHGLHAAHRAKSENGELLGIVHRDISPQNVIVGTDGLARVLDFGVAKAVWRVQTTRDGQVKGKLSYMAPEQATGGKVGPWTDVYSATVVLWEALTLRKLFHRTDEDGILGRFTGLRKIEPPSEFNSEVSEALDKIVAKGLQSAPEARFQSAEEMAEAIEAAVPLASNALVAKWLQRVAVEELRERSLQIALVENDSSLEALPEPPSNAGRSGANGESAAKQLATTSESLAGTPSRSESQAEDPSRISLARSQVPSRGHRGRLPLAILAAGAGLLIAGGWLLSLRANQASAPAVAAVGAPTAPLPPPSPPAASIALPAPSEPVAPSAALSAPGPAAESSATAESSPHTKAPKLATTYRAKPHVDCNPPYTVDSRGVRRLKPACIK